MGQPVVWPQRRGTGPHLVVKEIGHRLDRWIAVGPHVEVTAHLDMADLAEQASLDDLLLDVDQVWGALALSAYLHNALVLAGSGKNRFAFQHVHADRLLQIHIRAGLDGRDGLKACQ